MEKTDRAALAGLFTEAAMRLTDDLKPPAKAVTSGSAPVGRRP